ncbi:hypothetical protein VC83_08404 [Pseudogymnoascus destructans]|uniref:Uncharacterized protein n=1 Tax=Pseudogymnoascus destructans TaxID=655981 RepID=A0A176ZZ59_9PEZI|nr:uncharacterized protein VC83_08404 [Pseudogymnoascus destructans]OAF55178.1 hypothetical protein VC83_08404 [Pseudogymnoascus destructans]
MPPRSAATAEIGSRARVEWWPVRARRAADVMAERAAREFFFGVRSAGILFKKKKNREREKGGRLEPIDVVYQRKKEGKEGRRKKEVQLLLHTEHPGPATPAAATAATCEKSPARAALTGNEDTTRAATNGEEPLRAANNGEEEPATREPEPAATPSKARKERLAVGRGPVGARRAVACLGCVRSAVAGKSLGDCHDQPGAIPGVGRCWRCASGHSCMPVPAAVAPSAAALLAGLAADPALSVAKRNRLRGYVRDALAVADKKPGGSSSAPAPTNDLAAAPGFGAPVPLSGFGAPVSLSAVAFGQFGAPSPFGAHVLGSFAAPPPPAQGAQLGALLAQLGGLLAPSPGGPSVLARRAMIMAILGQVVDSLLE